MKRRAFGHHYNFVPALCVRGVLSCPVTGPNPARDDVRQTTFSDDVLGRYICNNWQEITAAQAPGAFPFDAIAIGGGMYRM